MFMSPSSANKTRLKLVRQSGFSLIEALIALTVTLTVLALGMSFVFQSWKTQSFAATQNMLKQHAEGALFKMSKGLAEAKILFEENAEGVAYKNKLAFTSAAPQPVTNSFLPTIRGNGTIYQSQTCEVDGEEYFWGPSVGNSLYFVSLSGVLDMQVEGVALSTTVSPRVLDLYRFRYFYITDQYEDSGVTYKISRHVNTPRPALQLMEWSSELYVDYRQLKSFFDDVEVTASDKAAVLAKLNEMEVEAAWEKGEPNPAQAFRNLNTSLSSKNAGYKIKAESLRKVMPWSNSSSDIYSIAYNQDLSPASPTFFDIRLKVPQFFVNDPPEDCSSATTVPMPSENSRPTTDFPLGFEVAIVGPNSGRTVHMHLSVVGQTNYPRLVEQSHSLSAYAKDL